jgi:carboxyl-terminal processing protease
MVLALLLVFLSFFGIRHAGQQPPADVKPAEYVLPSDISPGGVFDEAWVVIRNAFFDPNLKGVDWDAVREELRPKAEAAHDAAALSAVINEALARLHASHTHHYHQDQREYYEILDVFNPDGMPERKGSKIKPGRIEYVGIGLVATVIDGRTFAADVYDTGPAARAGILPGDEILAVEGGPWGDIAPFREREGKPTRITIQRTKDPASKQDITVTPELIQPHEMFLAAERASARIVEHEGMKAAYIRIRSYAHESYQDALKQIIADKFLDTDHPLIIDLRGGWGGARPSYMDVFNPVAPQLTFISRDGKSRTIAPTWPRPVVMMIDGASRSGKEVLAYAFKKHHVGTLVGEKTAGAVLAGTPRPLADGSVLYLAVQGVTVDGEILEGVGVTPDVVVSRDLPYCAGADKQLNAAIIAANKPPASR